MTPHRKNLPQTPRPSRLAIVREKGAEGVPKLAKRGHYQIPIDLLVEDPRNERKTYRGMEELTATVRSLGVIEPITVVPLEDGRYRITTGHRRFRATRAAGLDRISVFIGEPEEESLRRRKSVISNVQRQEVDAVEMAEGLLALKQEDPTIQTNRDLAALVGKSEQWVGEMLKILTLPESVRRRIAEAHQPLAYDAVVQISRLATGRDQETLLEEALRGSPVREIRRKAKELRNASQPNKPSARTNTFETSHATVTVRFKGENSSIEHLLEALERALALARNLN